MAGRRATVDAVTGWIEQHVACLEAEPIALARAVGRVAATDVTTTVRMPPVDRAAIDGVALRAGETVGASSYNPLAFALASADVPLPPGSAVTVAAGAPLPAGADAVVPLDQVELSGDGRCALVEPIGVGSDVERAGSQIAPGDRLVPAGRRIDAYHIGVLTVVGIEHVTVIRQPRVRVVSITPPAGAPDTNRPLLEALLARDGARVEAIEVARARDALAQALATDRSDLVLVIGGTGPGRDDIARAALAAAGEVAIDGVAVRQCETACVGRTRSGIPVFLLPGMPAACLWAYELVAGGAVRRRAGGSTALPFAARPMTTARKIASIIGVTDVCPVRCRADDKVEPIASFAEAGLAAAIQADGFVIVPAGSEGYARDSAVMVYLLRPWTGQ
jgi:molybdopterin molybdotransferase